MRLSLLNRGLRSLVRPVLQVSRSPEHAALAFEIAGPVLFPGPPFVTHLTEKTGGLRLNWISCGPVDATKVLLYIHGGAYLCGSGRAYGGFLGRISKLTGLRICAPDYRLMQDAPFPAAFDDARAAWDALIAKGYHPQDIVLAGDSAGGGLMLALLAHLTQTGQTPCAAVAMSPWTDLTLSGDSLSANAEAVLPVSRMAETVDRYLHDAARNDPRASPLFAQFAAPPPVLIQVGSGEALRSDAERMAAHLGDVATLKIWEGVPHVWQMFDGYVPEARAALQEMADFVQASIVSDKR
ncbi:alpha/beta hydrolase [Loktanella agnita]|uniref:alpha/beta hydrolase n=1 Tax=Loktanella agnita TaxID=287097 RepID=UPI0039880971